MPRELPLFATRKVELVNRTHYPTRHQARQAIFAWIARYNRHRLHSTLNMMPPIEWETLQSNPTDPAVLATAA